MSSAVAIRSIDRASSTVAVPSFDNCNQMHRRWQYGVASANIPATSIATSLFFMILPDFERADRIGEFWGGHPETGTSGELPFDFGGEQGGAVGRDRVLAEMERTWSAK
jgi:hypothetical protein